MWVCHSYPTPPTHPSWSKRDGNFSMKCSSSCCKQGGYFAFYTSATPGVLIQHHHLTISLGYLSSGLFVLPGLQALQEQDLSKWFLHPQG